MREIRVREIELARREAELKCAEASLRRRVRGLVLGNDGVPNATGTIPPDPGVPEAPLVSPSTSTDSVGDGTDKVHHYPQPPGCSATAWGELAEPKELPFALEEGYIGSARSAAREVAKKLALQRIAETKGGWRAKTGFERVGRAEREAGSGDIAAGLGSVVTPGGDGGVWRR